MASVKTPTIFGEDIFKITENTRAKKSCSAFGVQNNLRAWIASLSADNIIYIASDYISACKIKEYFEAFDKNVYIFPENNDSFIFKHAQSSANNTMRVQALFAMLSRKNNVIICTAESLLCPLASPQNFAKAILHLKVGQSFAPSKLATALAKSGYIRSDFASEPGQFSVRGELVDVFAINCKSAIRVDYFDDQIESLSYIDQTGKTTKQIVSASICPFSN